MRIAFVMLAVMWATTTPAAGLACRFEFTVTITQGAGPFRPGDRLAGHARFQTSGQSFPGEAGARVHMATGQMQLGDAITAPIWAVIATAQNPVADQLSLQARDAHGLSVAGIDYRGPMTLSLYARPGTLGDATIPADPGLWAAMDLRRSFALHAYGYDRLAGDVTELTVACGPPEMIDSGDETTYPAPQ
jgi:hypothetical protein